MYNAPETGADVVCFDLEDAVAPGRKDEARRVVRDVLSDPDFDPAADVEVCVRVTPTEPLVDLDGILPKTLDDVRLDAVMLPKVESTGPIESIAAACSERGLDIAVFALVETAAGVLTARSIAAAEPTSALVFGAEDLTADVGATRTETGTEVLYARQHVVLAAGAADVDAIDTVFPEFEDDAGLEADAETAVTFGYDGKIAIHPNQVPIINDAFTPSTERIAWAERVLAARDEAEATDRGVFEVDGQMIDAPLITQAERVLERARAAGIR